MIRIGNVLTFLCPDVNWVARGETYDDIDWCGEKPAITKKEFEAGFVAVEAAKKAEADAKVAAKTTAQAKLAALGLTVEDLTALGL